MRGGGRPGKIQDQLSGTWTLKVFSNTRRIYLCLGGEQPEKGLKDTILDVREKKDRGLSRRNMLHGKFFSKRDYPPERVTLVGGAGVGCGGVRK